MKHRLAVLAVSALLSGPAPAGEYHTTPATGPARTATACPDGAQAECPPGLSAAVIRTAPGSGSDSRVCLPLPGGLVYRF